MKPLGRDPRPLRRRRCGRGPCAAATSRPSARSSSSIGDGAGARHRRRRRARWRPRPGSPAPPPRAGSRTALRRVRPRRARPWPAPSASPRSRACTSTCARRPRRAEILQPLVLAGPASAGGDGAAGLHRRRRAGGPAGRAPSTRPTSGTRSRRLRQRLRPRRPPRPAARRRERRCCRRRPRGADAVLACVGPPLASGRAGRRLNKALRRLPAASGRASSSTG